MKKIISVLFLVVLTYCNIYPQSGWVWQYPKYTGEPVYSMHFFPGTGTGYAVGGAGLFLKTTDNGTTWQIQNYLSDKNNKKIVFVDLQTGWLSSRNNYDAGITFRTTDGGNNWNLISYYGFESFFFIDGNTGWMPANTSNILKTINGGITSVFYPIDINPLSLFFLNNQTGFACGSTNNPAYEGKICKSTNGGENWVRLNYSFSGREISRIWFQNESSGYVFDNNNTAYKTTNGGLNWDSVKTNITGTLKGFMFFNMNTGFILTLDNCIKTTNGGINWNVIYHTNYASTYPFSSMYFKNIDTGYICNNKAQMFRTYNSGANWEVLYGQNNSALSDVKFFDVNTGIATGAEGALLRTTNGGINWIYSKFGETAFQSVTISDYQTMWTAGYGILLKTTNRGNNWTQKSTPVYNINCVYFTNSMNGWLVGDTLCRTTNGGENWFVNMPATQSSDFIQFVDTQTGWLSGPYAEIKKTTNGGINWFSLPNSDPATQKSVYFTNSLNGWAFLIGSNMNSYLYRTQDGGYNWVQYSPLFYSNLYQSTIKFINEQTGYILNPYDFRTCIYRTTNSGNNWTKYESGSSLSYYSIDFPDSQTGWIVGNNSSIKKNTNGGVYINQISNSLPESYSLFQNYPNPFNPVTTIKYQIPKNNMVTLKVYDALGREVETLVNEIQHAGTYEVQFPGNAKLNLASGVYFYKLTAGDFTTVKRMVLIK